MKRACRPLAIYSRSRRRARMDAAADDIPWTVHASGLCTADDATRRVRADARRALAARKGHNQSI